MSRATGADLVRLLKSATHTPAPYVMRANIFPFSAAHSYVARTAVRAHSASESAVARRATVQLLVCAVRLEYAPFCWRSPRRLPSAPDEHRQLRLTHRKRPASPHCRSAHRRHTSTCSRPRELVERRSPSREMNRMFRNVAGRATLLRFPRGLRTGTKQSQEEDP